MSDDHHANSVHRRLLCRLVSCERDRYPRLERIRDNWAGDRVRATCRESRVPPKPDGIAAGTDGNLWVAETGVNKIARVTPTGAITEFPIKGGLLPSAVTAGPDGNLWFAQRGGVGYITSAGKVTIDKVDGIISSITPGPDGNLWLTESGKAKVGLQAAAANTRHVLHLASGFLPKTKAVAQGQSVEWINEMPGLSTVQQTSKPPIFDSSSQGTGSTYTVRFAVAGTYACGGIMLTHRTRAQSQFP